MADKSINFSWTNNIENKTLTPGSVVLDKTRGNLHIKSESKEYCFESSKSHYLADYSWEQIVELCKTGEAASMFRVGDMKPLNITYKYGYNNSYTHSESPCVVLVGINHDKLVNVSNDYNKGKSTACLTFRLIYPWSNRVSINGTPNFEGKPVKYSSTYHYNKLQDGTFSSAFETVVKNNIQDVKKKCLGETKARFSSTNSYAPDNSTPSLVVEEINCKLFEPSLSELNLVTNLEEGEPYEYYRKDHVVGQSHLEVIYYQQSKSASWSDLPTGTFYTSTVARRFITRSMDFTYFSDGSNNTYSYNSKRYFLPYSYELYNSDGYMCVYRTMMHTYYHDSFSPFIFFCL